MDDLIAVRAYPTGGPQTELTTDRDVVNAALDSIHATFERPLTAFNLTPSEVIDISSGDQITLDRVVDRECRNDRSCRRLIRGEADSLAAVFEMRVAQSLSGLEAIISDMSRLAGRKVLVLLSGGLLASDRVTGRVSGVTDQIAVGRAAAAAEVTLYALHLDDAFMDAFSASRTAANVSTLFRDAGMFATGLEMVAGAAGGEVFRLQSRSPDVAIDRIVRETSFGYVLGVDTVPDDRDGRPHVLRVRVKRAGATVRHRASVIVAPR